MLIFQINLKVSWHNFHNSSQFLIISFLARAGSYNRCIFLKIIFDTRPKMSNIDNNCS